MFELYNLVRATHTVPFASEMMHVSENSGEKHPQVAINRWLFKSSAHHPHPHPPYTFQINVLSVYNEFRSVFRVTKRAEIYFLNPQWIINDPYTDGCLIRNITVWFSIECDSGGSLSTNAHADFDLFEQSNRRVKTNALKHLRERLRRSWPMFAKTSKPALHEVDSLSYPLARIHPSIYF